MKTINLAGHGLPAELQVTFDADNFTWELRNVTTDGCDVAFKFNNPAGGNFPAVAIDFTMPAVDVASTWTSSNYRHEGLEYVWNSRLGVGVPVRLRWSVFTVRRARIG